MLILKTFGLFVLTTVAEIIGCYLPYLRLKKSGSPWLLIPATMSLLLFACLLTLHPTAAGRVYAAYGGVYVSVAIFWLWVVEVIAPLPGISSALQSPCRVWQLSFLARNMAGSRVLCPDHVLEPQL